MTKKIKALKARAAISEAIKDYKKRNPDVEMNVKILSESIGEKRVDNLYNYAHGKTPEALNRLFRVSVFLGVPIEKLIIKKSGTISKSLGLK